LRIHFKYDFLVSLEEGTLKGDVIAKATIVKVDDYHVGLAFIGKSLLCNTIPLRKRKFALSDLHETCLKSRGRIVLRLDHDISHRDLEISRIIVDLFEGRTPLRTDMIKLYPVKGRNGLLLETIKNIPRGKVTTYRALGTLLKMHPRAVGGYIASNPFPLLIPCHRVIKSDLTLGGYAYGQLIKGNLLIREGVDLDIETGKISPSDVLDYEDLLKIIPLRILV